MAGTTRARRGPATLIVSPLASRIVDAQARARVVNATIAAIRVRGHPTVEVVETADPATIRATAADAVAAGTTLLVLAGGDGTVRDGAAGLAGTGVELAIVPCGTGNLYATAIGLPRTPPAAVAVIATGAPAPFDLGEVRFLDPASRSGLPNDPVGPARGRSEPCPPPSSFVVACGTGFDAQLIATTSREKKRRYGVAAYILAASRLLPGLAGQPTVLTVDGERTELESVVVLVANAGEAIPGVLRSRLPVDASDGRLHVFVLLRAGIIGGLRGALELIANDRTGLSRSGHALRLSAHQVRVEVSPPAPTQVDGDPYPAASLEARIRPGALRIIRP
jgi:diacylglycerol kinase family enzyme